MSSDRETEPAIRFLDSHLGLESVSLEIGFTDDPGDRATKHPVGKKAGSQADGLADRQPGSLFQRYIDPGLEGVGPIENRHRGRVGIVHVEHPLLSGHGEKAEDNAVDRTQDPGPVEREFPPGDLRCRSPDVGGKVDAHRFKLGFFGNQLRFLRCQGLDFGLVSLKHQLGLLDFPFGYGATSGAHHAVASILQFEALHSACLDLLLERPNFCRRCLDSRFLGLGPGLAGTHLGLGRGKIEIEILANQGREEISLLDGFAFENRDRIDDSVDQRGRLDRQGVGFDPAGGLKQGGCFERVGQSIGVCRCLAGTGLPEEPRATEES